MNSKMNTKKTLLASMVGLFAAAGGASSAMAQGDEAATAQGRIDEIIVTANKREQSLQDVAMSVSALTGDTIEKRGLVGMDDYLRTLPGVSMQDRGASQNNIVIRGIASDPQLEDSTAGIYFGETPVTGLGSASSSDKSGSVDIKLVDIERIEVLRGPQGTLYGSGSMGGTVRVIPVSPNLNDVEGKLVTRYSKTGKEGGDNTVLQGVINIPLVEDKLAIRGVAYRFDNSGHIENVAASQPASVAGAVALGGTARDQGDIGTDQYTGFRVMSLWKSTDNLSITLAYTQQEIEQDGVPDMNLLLEDTYQQVRIGTGVSGDKGEFLGNDLDITNLMVEYDLSWGNVTSSSSWINYEAINNADLGGGGLPLFTDNVTTGDVFVEEIRLTSKFDGPLQFLAGIYYEDREKDVFASALFNGNAPFTGLVFSSNTMTSTTQQAFFGELSYQVTKQIMVTAGARFFDYDQQRRSIASSFTEPEILDLEEKEQIYKANITYTPTKDVLLYGQWAEGYRLGRPQTKFDPLLCDTNNDGRIDALGISAPDNVASDTSENFELGIKSSLVDNRVTLNAAIYRINWQGMPISLPVPPPCGGALFLNAGESSSEGIELETQARLTDNLQLELSASYGEAKLTEDAENLGSDGDDLPGSADFNASFALQYTFTLAGFDAFARGDYAYVGEYYDNIAEEGQVSGGYSEVHLKTGITYKAIDVDLFVNNLTNADDITWIDKAFGRAYRLRPRTFGLNIRYSF